MSNVEEYFVVNDIPAEWRIQAESITIPENPLPNNLIQSISIPPNLAETTQQDFSKLPKHSSAMQDILTFSQELIKELNECCKYLEMAEQKRREISSSAELLNGICTSQITEEQRLTVFVNSIDKFLAFYDNLDRIYIDFKSPGFTVLTPDFSSDIRKISEGIKFFQNNSNFKESKLFLLRYTSLQNKAFELATKYITINLDRTIHLSKGTDPYQKFKLIAPTIKRLYKMIENTPRFSNALTIYKEYRLQIIQPYIEYTTLEKSLLNTLDYIQKEYELACNFYDFTNEIYSQSMLSFVSDLIDYFSSFCVPDIYNTNDVVQLCDYHSFLTGQRLMSRITSIQIGSQLIKDKIKGFVNTTQERIIALIPTISYSVAESEETTKYMILLSKNLTRDQFSQPAYRLISEAMRYIEEQSNLLKDVDEMERNAYIIGHYFTLKKEIDSIGKEVDGDTIEFWNLIHNSNRGHLVLLRQIESNISLHCQAIGSEITQFLLNPLFNLKARNTFAKPQVIATIEGISIAIDTFFKDEIAVKLNKYLHDQDEKDAIINEIKVQLILAFGECLSHFPDLDEELKRKVESIRNQIQTLTL